MILGRQDVDAGEARARRSSRRTTGCAASTVALSPIVVKTHSASSRRCRGSLPIHGPTGALGDLATFPTGTALRGLILSCKKSSTVIYLEVVAADPPYRRRRMHFVAVVKVKSSLPRGVARGRSRGVVATTSARTLSSKCSFPPEVGCGRYAEPADARRCRPPESDDAFLPERRLADRVRLSSSCGRCDHACYPSLPRSPFAGCSGDRARAGCSPFFARRNPTDSAYSRSGVRRSARFHMAGVEAARTCAQTPLRERGVASHRSSPPPRDTSTKPVPAINGRYRRAAVRMSLPRDRPGHPSPSRAPRRCGRPYRMLCMPRRRAQVPGPIGGQSRPRSHATPGPS